MEFFRTVLWILLGRWAYNVISLVSFGIIVSKIEVDSYGIYVVASTLIIFSDVFFTEVGESAVVRSQFSPDRIGFTASATLLLFGLLISLFALAVSGFVGSLYSSELMMHLIQVIAVIVPIQAVSAASRGLLLKAGATRLFATAISAGNLVGAGLGVAAVFFGLGVWSLILQQFAVHLTALLVARIWGRIGFWGRFHREVFFDLATFSWPGFWSSLLNVAGNRLDIIAASIFFGAEGAGLFGLAKRLIQILQDLVGSSFDKALMSLRARSGNRDPSVLYVQSIASQAMVSIPAFVGFALTASLIVPLFFGSEWQAAGPLVSLMALGGIFRAMVTIERAEQMSEGRMNAILVVRFAEFAVAAILVFSFGSVSLSALAVVFSVRYFIGYNLVLVSLYRKDVFSRSYRVYQTQAPMWFSSASMALGIEVWRHFGVELPSLYYFLTLVGIGILIYIASMATLKRFWYMNLRGKYNSEKDAD